MIYTEDVQPITEADIRRYDGYIPCDYGDSVNVRVQHICSTDAIARIEGGFYCAAHVKLYREQHVPQCDTCKV